MTNKNSALIIVTVFLGLVLPPSLPLQAEEDFREEHHDRSVDMVGLQTKVRAIAELKAILKKKKGTQSEPKMWLKLAEIQEQVASIQFRVTYGDSHENKTEVKNSEYEKRVQEVIGTADWIVQKFYSLPEIDEVFYMRGSAYEQIKKKDFAKRDYLYLLDHFKKSLFVPQTYMAVADIEIDANRHEEAIKYLTQVERFPENSHYPFALYKLAWSYFLTKNVDKTMYYIKKNIDYYKSKVKPGDPSSISLADRAILEHSLLDVAAFYFGAFEMNASGFTTKNALDYFRNLENGPTLGGMCLYYAKLLRSHAHDDDLIQFKNKLIQDDPSRSSTLGVIQVALEYFYNNRKYDTLLEVAKDIRKLDLATQGKMRRFDNYPDAQLFLLGTANKLRGSSLKEKDPAEEAKLVKTAKDIYILFLALADDGDPRVSRVHYNLAELLFLNKEYTDSIQHYQWLVEHWTSKMEFPKKDLTLKLVSASYQLLGLENQIPKKLVPVALSSPKANSAISLNPSLSTFLHWVDVYRSAYGVSEAEIQNFEFELDRMIYDQGKVKIALDRLMDFIEDSPDSKFFTASAMLIIDTQIVSESWEDVNRIAERILTLNDKAKKPDQEFKSRVFTIAGDSFYKMIETRYKTKDYTHSSTLIGDFKSRYWKNAHLSDVLFLASQIEIETKDFDRASEDLSDLIDHFPKSANRNIAFLSRASIADGQYDFKSAVTDYQKFLFQIRQDKNNTKFSEVELKEISKRLLLLESMSAKSSDFDCSFYAGDRELVDLCSGYQALGLLKDGSTKTGFSFSVQNKVFEGGRFGKPLWAAVALKLAKKLSIRERLLLAKVFATEWDRLGAIAQFATIPTLNGTLVQAFKDVRESIGSQNSIKSNDNSIERRIKLLSSIEDTAYSVIKLPWIRVSVEVLSEVSGIYSDLVTELKELPSREDFSREKKAEYLKAVEPVSVVLRKKAQDLKAQAVTIAQDYALETEVAQRLYAATPVRQSLIRKIAKPLDLNLLESVDPSFRWASADSKAGDPTVPRLKALWAGAFRMNDYEKMAFLIQELKKKDASEASSIKLLEAFSLASAGAQSEGISELESMRKTLSPTSLQQLDPVLYTYFVQTSSSKKADAFLQEMRKDNP